MNSNFKEYLNNFVIDNMNIKLSELKNDKYILKYFNEELLASYLLEHEEFNKNNIRPLYDYLVNLGTNEPPNLINVYKLMFNDVYVRKDDVVLGRKFNKYGVLIKAEHIGISFKDINDELFGTLQNEINEFYKRLNNKINLNTLIRAFELYIKFERIHIFKDGNGRIGRLLFLEHPFKYCLFPYSKILKTLGCQKYNDIIFNKYNLKYEKGIIEMYDKNEYLNFKIDSETEFEISKIIYKFIVYRNLMNINKKYIPCIKTILNTKIEDIYDKQINRKNWYSYSDICECIDEELHDVCI